MKTATTYGEREIVEENTAHKMFTSRRYSFSILYTGEPSGSEWNVEKYSRKMCSFYFERKQNKRLNLNNGLDNNQMDEKPFNSSKKKKASMTLFSLVLCMPCICQLLSDENSFIISVFYVVVLSALGADCCVFISQIKSELQWHRLILSHRIIMEHLWLCFTCKIHFTWNSRISATHFCAPITIVPPHHTFHFLTGSFVLQYLQRF